MKKKNFSALDICSLFFCRATELDVIEMFLDLQNDDYKTKYLIKWELFCNISFDWPNVNKAMYKNFDQKLKDINFKGLLPYLSCTAHVVHNGFRKRKETLQNNADTLAFDLHPWFKAAPCQGEDFKAQSESTPVHNESLFLRRVNTRLLPLATTLEKVLERWENTKRYFLDYLPNQPEFKKHSQRTTNIKESLVI